MLMSKECSNSNRKRPSSNMTSHLISTGIVQDTVRVRPKKGLQRKKSVASKIS